MKKQNQPPTSSPAPVSPPRWETVEQAAKRHGKSVGHMTRICRKVRAAGWSRMEKAFSGGQAKWHVRQDFQIDAPHSSAAICQNPIIIQVGELQVTIEPVGSARVLIETVRKPETSAK